MSLPEKTASATYPRILWIIPALTLVIAALSKVSAPTEFLYQLSDYNFNLDMIWQAGAVLILPIIEMGLGLCLLFFGYRWAALSAIALFSFFITMILLGLPRGYLHHCGCLGAENLEPGLAILKNVFLVGLLSVGCFLKKGMEHKGNPWGALGLILGAVISMRYPLIIIMFAIFLLSLSGGLKSFLYVGAGMAAGIVLQLLEIPVLMVPIFGTFLFLPRIIEKPISRLALVTLTVIIALISWYGFTFPEYPSAPHRYLHERDSFKEKFSASLELSKDSNQRSLVLYLDPECQTCRSLMPVIKALSQRSDLPPLTGLSAAELEKLKAFAAENDLRFPILQISESLFEKAVPQTPLLILVEHDTICFIYPEGQIPSPASIEELLSREQ